MMPIFPITADHTKKAKRMNFAYKYLFKNNLFVISMLFISALTIRIQFVKPNLNHIYTARDAKQYIEYPGAFVFPQQRPGRPQNQAIGP